MRAARKTQHQTSKQASTNKNICCTYYDVKKYLYRRPTRLPASRCPALHPRRSRRSEHRERRECRRHRHPIPRRVGRGRVINYASNSMKYREARLYRTQGYHLKATCEAQRFCEKSAAPPKCRLRRRRRGWRHFRPRLTSYAYVHDGYYRALRRPLYSQHAFDTRSACRNHPQNEVP